EHFVSLLKAYKASGLAEENLCSEIFASSQKVDEGKFLANVWEAMVYRHILNLKYTFIKPTFSGKDKLGPDFCFSYNDQNIWIEATSLNPGPNFPSEWLDAEKRKAGSSMPHEAMLLRWTTALAEKNKQYKKWNNIVKDDEPFIIAINSSRLSLSPHEDFGISQTPWAVEATYPVRHWTLSKQGIKYSARLSVEKSPKVNIPTGIFLNPDYNQVSAVIGCSRNCMLGDKLYLSVVHNPLAVNPCPQKIFGDCMEYILQENYDSWDITPIQ
ncbi:MAG: hypothetical protein ACK48E_01630, partial [Holosporales bacterium]